MSRRSWAPLVVLGSFALMTGLTCAAPATDSGGGWVAVLLIFGLPVLGVWLLRLSQWAAARWAPARPAEIELLLAAGNDPSSFARFTQGVARAAGRDISPSGFCVWVRIHEGKTSRLQRVVWEPWLGTLKGRHAGLVRYGWLGASIIEVEGAGRLWPSSWLLHRRPFGVQLIAWSQVSTSRLETAVPTPPRKAWAILAGMLGLFALAPLLQGNYGTAIWAALFVTSFLLLIWAWYGLTPPGWLPAGR